MQIRLVLRIGAHPTLYLRAYEVCVYITSNTNELVVFTQAPGTQATGVALS